jgi:thioredoxin reductase
MICDAGAPRNARATEMHGFLTRDGIPPDEFLRLARDELTQYENVELRCAEVVEAGCRPDGFEVACRDGRRFRSRALLLATGVVDDLPRVEGLQELYGSSVHHCPYCDAWEWRDQPIAVYGQGDAAAGLALSLTQWSPDVVLCTDGPAKLSPKMRRHLRQRRVEIHEEKIARLEGRDGMLERIVLASDNALPRRALFFASGQHQHSSLPHQLGCRFTKKGAVATGHHESTNVPNLYVVGDASKDVQFVIVAAAEGAQAAVSINKALFQSDLHKKEN